MATSCKPNSLLEKPMEALPLNWGCRGGYMEILHPLSPGLKSGKLVNGLYSVVYLLLKHSSLTTQSHQNSSFTHLHRITPTTFTLQEKQCPLKINIWNESCFFRWPHHYINLSPECSLIYSLSLHSFTDVRRFHAKVFFLLLGIQTVGFNKDFLNIFFQTAKSDVFHLSIHLVWNQMSPRLPQNDFVLHFSLHCCP